MLSRNGQPVGHWFDGDGGILAVHFHAGQATGVYRYVQTSGYCQEEQAGCYLLGGYGMMPAGSWLERLTREIKNAANTSVLALPDRLLALWEGGLPHALTLDTLDTIGLDDLGSLGKGPYSAHPKIDPVTGEIFNFGVSIGQRTMLRLYCSDATGRIQRQGAIALSGLPLIHDFVLTRRYLIFCIPPVRLNVLPVLARLKSFSDVMQWLPNLGTEVWVIDRNTLQPVSRTQTDSWFQWHFGNGWETSDGSVIFQLTRYEDFQTNQRLQEIVSGSVQTTAIAHFWEIQLDPLTGKVLENHCLLDRSCEFPTVAASQLGQPVDYTYLILHRPQADVQHDLFGAIARFDHRTSTLTEAVLETHYYPTEPIYAADADDPQQGWILTVVYNGQRDRSEVWIFAADRLNADPVCRLALPAQVPLGFHGTWVAQR
jgi:carotenoid cleavage dioxygenase-like enzyme